MLRLDICDSVVEFLREGFGPEADLITKVNRGWKIATKPEDLAEDGVRILVWPSRSFVYRNRRLNFADVAIEVVVQCRVNIGTPDELDGLISWVDDLLEELRGSSVHQTEDAVVNFTASWESTEYPCPAEISDLSRGIFTSRSLITFKVQLL